MYLDLFILIIFYYLLFSIFFNLDIYNSHLKYYENYYYDNKGYFYNKYILKNKKYIVYKKNRLINIYKNSLNKIYIKLFYIKYYIKNAYIIYYLQYVKNKILNFLYGVHTKNNMNYIRYYHNNKWYRIPLLSKISPPFLYEIEKVYDENLKDITKEYLEYLGPHKDFFNVKLKPYHLSFKKINIFLDNGNIILYNENDILKY